MVGLGGFGETLGDEGQTEMEQWSFLQVSMKRGLALLIFWHTLTPFSATEQRRRRRQEFAVYAARTPLTNNPCALWHRQSCWLCYCWLLPTVPAKQVGPVCLEWYCPKNKGLHWCASLQAALPVSLTETGFDGAYNDCPMPAGISSTIYISNILTRLIASFTNDECPEILHCSQIIPSSYSKCLRWRKMHVRSTKSLSAPETRIFFSFSYWDPPYVL